MKLNNIWKGLKPKPVEEVHCDYELGLIKAMLGYYMERSETVQLFGCYFHFVQALVRRQ